MAPPLQKPTTYDYFLLTEGSTSLYTPGPILEAKLDPRAVEITDQQQPGTAGSVAIQKLEKIWTGVYTYRLWTNAHFKDDKEFVRILRAGQKKGKNNRARVWRLRDPRINGLDITLVTVEEIYPLVQPNLGQQLWTRTIKFHEWKKPVKLPLLPVQPTEADKAFDREAKALEAERKALQAELDALKK